MAKIKTGPKVKRKGGGVAAKSAAVDRLAEQLERSDTVIVTEYRGLTVQELQDLRRKLRPRGVEYHVVKNSLFSRAADKTGKGAIKELLAGPTAVAVGSLDEAELAKGFVDETRTFKALRILGAFVSGRTMSAEDVVALAKLPPKPVLQGMLVGSLQAPLGQLVGVLTAAHSQFIRVLNAKSAQ